MAILMILFFLLNWNDMETIPVTPQLMDQMCKDIEKNNIQGRISSHLAHDIYNHYREMDGDWQMNHKILLDYIVQELPYLVYVRTYLSYLYLLEGNYKRTNELIEKPFIASDTLIWADESLWKKWYEKNPPSDRVLRHFLSTTQNRNDWELYAYTFAKIRKKSKYDLRFYNKFIENHKLFLLDSIIDGKGEIDKIIKEDINKRLYGKGEKPAIILYLEGKKDKGQSANKVEKAIINIKEHSELFLNEIMTLRPPAIYTISIVDSMIQDTAAFLKCLIGYPFYASKTKDPIVKCISLYDLGKEKDALKEIKKLKDDYWKKTIESVLKKDKLPIVPLPEKVRNMWLEE